MDHGLGLQSLLSDGLRCNRLSRFSLHFGPGRSPGFLLFRNARFAGLCRSLYSLQVLQLPLNGRFHGFCHGFRRGFAGFRCLHRFRFQFHLCRRVKRLLQRCRLFNYPALDHRLFLGLWIAGFHQIPTLLHLFDKLSRTAAQAAGTAGTAGTGPRLTAGQIKLRPKLLFRPPCHLLEPASVCRGLCCRTMLMEAVMYRDGLPGHGGVLRSQQICPFHRRGMGHCDLLLLRCLPDKQYLFQQLFCLFLFPFLILRLLADRLQHQIQIDVEYILYGLLGLLGFFLQKLQCHPLIHAVLVAASAQNLHGKRLTQRPEGSLCQLFLRKQSHI